MKTDRRKELVKEGGRQMLELADLVSDTKSSLSHVSDKLFPFSDKSAYRLAAEECPVLLLSTML